MKVERVIACCVLGLESLFLTALILSLDHEVQGVGDLLRVENYPAILLYGIPLWVMLMAVYWPLQGRNWPRLGGIVAIEAAVLAGFVWWSGSQAVTLSGQLLNLAVLWLLAAGALLAAAVLALLVGRIVSIPHRKAG